MHFSRICKHSKYVQIGLGYVALVRDNEKAGYSYALTGEYEYFFRDKFSYTPGLVYADFHLKNELRVVEWNQTNTFKYYFKIRKRFLFNVHTCLSLGTKNENYLKNDSIITYYGINLGFGAGLHYIPYRLFKRPNRFGVFVSINLLSFYHGYRAPYAGFGLKYRIE